MKYYFAQNKNISSILFSWFALHFQEKQVRLKYQCGTQQLACTDM